MGDGILGVLLAGGAGRRIGGGDKCLRELAGRTLLDHVIDRVRAQVGGLILSANGDPARFAKWGLEVVPDARLGGPPAGPLAGIAACLDWAAGQRPSWATIATFPTDAPFLPRDLVSRLSEGRAVQEAELACASFVSHDGERRSQPVIGLWPTALRHDLRTALDAGVRKVDIWTAQHSLAEITFEADDSPNGIAPFFNVNRTQDLAEAERLLADLRE